MAFCANFFTTVFILIIAVIMLIRYCFTYWSKRGVNTPPPTLFFGNATKIIFRNESLGVNISNFYNQFRKRGEKFFGYYFFVRPLFVPVDLDLLKRIKINDLDYFTDHIGHVDENDPLSMNMFISKGDRWKVLRSKLTPTFTSGKMKMMFSTILDCAQDLRALFEKEVAMKHEIDIKDVCVRYTSDIVISCVFGLETETQKNSNSEFYKQNNKFLGTGIIQSLRDMFVLILPEFFTLFKIKMFDKDLTNFFLNLVRSTVKYREENNVIRKDFMHLLLQVKNNVRISDNELGSLKNEKSDKEMISLSTEEMAAQCFVFYFAGYETSATTISFTLFELAQNSKIQNKLREEINLVLEKYNNEVTYDALMEMKYLNQCVFESLRKYPPVQISTRVCTKTYKIPGTRVIINKGMHVLIPIFGVHHDPEYYPNPEKFDPERFSDENVTDRHPSAFMPFGGGPRMCIGYRFGLLQVNLALVVLLKCFKFDVHPSTKYPLTFNPTTFITNAKPKIKLIAEKIII